MTALVTIVDRFMLTSAGHLLAKFHIFSTFMKKNVLVFVF